jgi:hypothetical protein
MIKKNGYLIITISLVLSFATGGSGMERMSSEELSGVDAGAGVTLFVDAPVKIDNDYLQYRCTDNSNALLLDDISLDNGYGGYRQLTGSVVLDAPTANVAGHYEFLQTGTNGGAWTWVPSASKTWASLLLPEYRDFYLRISRINYCGTDLGSLTLDNGSLDGMHFFLSGGVPGKNEIQYEIGLRLGTDRLKYIYGTGTNDFVGFEGFSLAGLFYTGSQVPGPGYLPGSDLPGYNDPNRVITPSEININTAAWNSTGTFNIGNIQNNPAKFNVYTANGTTRLALNVTGSGSVRFDNVFFGGRSVGPSAIDGIRLHFFAMRWPQ